MPLPYDGRLIPRAKELRKNMTPQEQKLWYQYLARYPVRFQRQKVIEGFIVDFFCAKAMLAVEVDGIQHTSEKGMAYDKDRTVILEQNLTVVLRFTNSDVGNRFGEVCHSIDCMVQKRIAGIW